MCPQGGSVATIAEEEEDGLTEPLLLSSAEEEEHANPDDQEQPVASATAEPPTSRPSFKAVAWASSTPLLAKLLIPLLILGTHCLFYYGQSANMWKLSAQWSMDLRYQTVTKETKLLFEALKLKTQDELIIPETNRDIRVFTYLYAIQELWRAKHMPGVFLPRLASCGLIVFSGIWPHLKLLLLLLTWWFSRQPQRRRRILNALSILGKWSLVDVLVVCVMVGVLNLEWNFEGKTAMEHLLLNWSTVVPLIHSVYGSNEDLCGKALKHGCHNPSKVQHIIDCKACKTAVNGFFDHPEPIMNGLEIKGGGNGKLEVNGLHGIYGFCGAVIASILLSAIVDWFDLKIRRALEKEDRNTSADRSLEVTEGYDGTTEAGEDSAQGGLLLTETGNVDRRSEADRAFDRQIFVEAQQIWNACWQAMAWITFALVVYASLCITMERRVHGALPKLLHDLLGVAWSKQYSFWLLGWTMEGGWDFMLMGTFCWFIIAGPIVRSILCVRAARRTERPGMDESVIRHVHAMQERMRTSIDFVGAFCAWEVFTVAILMVDLLMPSITSTIINDKRCKLLSQDSHSCFEVEFDMRRTFWVVIGAGILLWIVSLRIRTYRVYD